MSTVVVDQHVEDHGVDDREHRGDVQAAQPADLGSPVPERRGGQPVAVGVALDLAGTTRTGPRTARRGTTAATRRAIGPERGQRQPPPGRLEEAGEAARSATAAARRRRCPARRTARPTRSSADADRGQRERGRHGQAKIRIRPCTIRRPMPVAGGRIHIATFARVNGSSSSQNARAAAPEVRLPHRYASSRAPPGPKVAPYSDRGRKKPGLAVAGDLAGSADGRASPRPATRIRRAPAARSGCGRG